MKATAIISSVLFILLADSTGDWTDTKNGMDFFLNQSKHIVKENCKKIAISSFNIGYVLTAKGEKKVVRLDTEISGISQADIQKLTDKLYNQFAEKWKAAGYEVVDAKTMMECKTLAKDVEKGSVKKGGSGGAAFTLQVGNSKLGETFDVSYFVPDGVPNYGQAKVPMMNPGKISKELNAVVLDVTFVFNTVDFKRSESSSNYSLQTSSHFEVNATPFFSTSSGGGGTGNTNMNTQVNIQYTSPKNFISTGMVTIKQGVSAEAKFVSETKNETLADKNSFKHVKRTYVTSPEAFGKETSEWCGGFMDAFIKKFRDAVVEEK